MNRMLKYILIGFLTIILMSLIFSFGYAKDKTFSGKVVDADTGEPMEGVAVVLYWHEASWIPFGEWIVRLKDVKETLTDKNGEWTVKGPAGSGVNSFAYQIALMGVTFYTREPEFIVFKPGYCSWPNGFSIDACKGGMRTTGYKEGMMGEGGTLQLPKLNKKEDRWRNESVGPIYGGSDDPKEERRFLKKQIEFLRLLNEERRSLGLDEYKIYRELINEK